jgi:hypothetical protein
MILFHFVVRTLQKLQLLGLADKPRKKESPVAAAAASWRTQQL